MIEEKIARAKTLIKQREEIDAELASLFGIAETPKRGRPRKESTTNGPTAPLPMIEVPPVPKDDA